jgi:2-oxo-4-hydroxy-4-carboxy-5-ureidoimidazoline decarboxylase
MTLDHINSLSRAEFVDALGATFEHSPWVAEQAWSARPFASVSALHTAMASAVSRAPQDEQLAFLRAHPDLAGKEADAGTMTAASTQEQAGAGLMALSRAEAARIRQLNTAYRARFDFPFIACVAHYTKAGIFFEFERRLLNDRETEMEAALTQIFAITRLRLDKRLAAPELAEALSC